MKIYLVRDEDCRTEAAFKQEAVAAAYARALNSLSESSYGEYDVWACRLDEPCTINPVLGFKVSIREGELPGAPSMVLVGREEDRVDVGSGGTMKGVIWADASAATEAEATRKAKALIAKKRAEIGPKKVKKRAKKKT